MLININECGCWPHGWPRPWWWSVYPRDTPTSTVWPISLFWLRFPLSVNYLSQNIDTLVFCETLVISAKYLVLLFEWFCNIIPFTVPETPPKKIAFQWDAYRPLQWPWGWWCLPRRGPSQGGRCSCGQTDTCENITFPQLLLRTVINRLWYEGQRVVDL